MSGRALLSEILAKYRSEKYAATDESVDEIIVR
jgi:hypothetical protein